MDLNFNFKEIFSAFMVLFAVIDITGSTPVIIGLKDKGLKVEAGKAALLSSVIFLLFLFLGDAILSLFGVDIQSFAVAGSIIILILACEMVLDIEIFKYQGPGGSATVVPIIFPLIHVENIIVAILLNMVIVYFVLRYLNIAERILGKGGVYILRKFFGIILLAIAVKLFTANIASLF